MTFVSETALRDLIKEALATPNDEMPYTDGVDLPILVNPTLDSTLARVDGSVVDVQFVPRDKVEFEVAVKSLTKNLPDEVIATLYAKVRDAIEDLEKAECACDSPGGVEDVKKKNVPAKASVEETIRSMVRKLVREAQDDDAHVTEPFATRNPGLAGGRKRIPAFADLEAQIDDALGTHGGPDEPLDEPGREEHRRMVDKEEGWDVDPFDTSSVDDETKSDWDPEGEPDNDEDDLPSAPGAGKKGRGKLGHGVGHGFHGKSFDEIADTLGISVAGAKRLEHVALAKVAYMMDLGPAEASELVLTAADDYITQLAKSGELTPEEVDDLYTNTDTLTELEGFREYLHNVIRKDMKASGVEFYPRLDDKGKPVLDKTGAQIHRGDKDEVAESDSPSRMGESRKKKGRSIKEALPDPNAAAPVRGGLMSADPNAAPAPAPAPKQGGLTAKGKVITAIWDAVKGVGGKPLSDDVKKKVMQLLAPFMPAVAPTPLRAPAQITPEPVAPLVGKAQ